MTELILKLSYSRESGEKIVIGVNSVRNLQEVARGNIMFYNRQIEKSLGSLKKCKKDDYDTIDKKRRLFTCFRLYVLVEE